MEPHNRFYEFVEDFRDPFSRDRDRVLHASSFRRLEYKTQVFLNHEGDYFRTRLTHSLEVSQIARTLARTLGLNETLCEVIALSHDLGHTPFGHTGGDMLDILLREDGHTNGFEHNFQSFRVLTKLEKRYKGFDGLNLTYATLEGVLKHSYPYKKSFTKELEGVFALDKHPSLEAIVVDKADEIAYVSHDIDDGIKYQLINWDDFKDEPLFCRIEAKLAGMDQQDRLYRHRFVAALITLLVEDFIANSKDPIKAYDRIKPLCSTLDARSVVPIGFSSEVAREIKQMKKLLFSKLYRHQKIAQKMFAGKQCIRGLYKAFTQEIDLLPSRQKEILQKRQSHRVIADYIASMTDRYAIKEYHRIYGFEF
ncbi:MAG TPA: deoxyguanosinetriphosphate triphosphohydrolase [Epsilonproteobacteria bacterium]|nr:deoxyguanosinetriphosphate triphosphohydrolase [Campylobacterota bacterium]